MVLREGVVMSAGTGRARGVQRRRFIAQYPHEAARLVVDSGRTISAVASELGVGAQLLGEWVSAEREFMEPEAFSPDERAELKRFRKENADVRMDNEFLGEAAALVAARHR